MTEVQDTAATFRALLSALQDGDVDTAVEHFAEDGRVIDCNDPEAALVGRAAIAEVLRGYWDVLPDMTLEATGILTGSDRLSGELVIKGTPVGQTDPVTLRFGVFQQYRDGKIEEERLYSDSRQMPDGL
jgi:ketosteroid isomerase-like protein